MVLNRRRLLATAAGAAALSGCVGGPDDGNPANTGTTGGGTDATGGGMAATVGVADHPSLGALLVGPDGLTLYMFDNDEKGAGSSSCTDGCADAWPPLIVDGEPTPGDGVDVELSTFERADGGVQVAAAGWPLYYFASDEEPGDAKGQGSNGVWWVLGPDGSPRTATETETGGGGAY